MKYLISILILIGLWYVTIPVDSKSAGVDTSIFYTNDRRGVITKDFYEKFQEQNCSSFKFFNYFCYIKPFRINHSTILATSYFEPKKKSTYLEEYFYPLRGSVIVNGYEPYDEKGKAFNKYSEPLIYNGQQYVSQVSVKYITSSVWNRIIVYVLIWIAVFWIFYIIKYIRIN